MNASTTISSTSAAPSTNVSGAPVNYTAIGPVGPSVGWVYMPDHPNSTVCNGNLFNLSIKCCEGIGGVINMSTVYCDPQCCSLFTYGLTWKTCKENGHISYPFCVLPPTALASDWEQCYNSSQSSVVQSLNMSVATIYRCDGPQRQPGAARSLSTPMVVVLVSTLVSAVFAAV